MIGWNVLAQRGSERIITIHNIRWRGVIFADSRELCPDPVLYVISHTASSWYVNSSDD